MPALWKLLLHIHAAARGPVHFERPRATKPAPGQRDEVGAFGGEVGAFGTMKPMRPARRS
jgi:hypothetical protein